jgi:hypothetical protein
MRRIYALLLLDAEGWVGRRCTVCGCVHNTWPSDTGDMGVLVVVVFVVSSVADSSRVITMHKLMSHHHYV